MVVITGSNGFIGSVMVRELNHHGINDILCVDPISLAERPGPLSQAKYSNFISSDEFLERIENHSLGKNIDFVIHMGACSSTTEMNREYLYKNNTLYTQKLFEWCQENKICFIYASSAATYGAGEMGFDDNTAPESLKPLNPYGDSKLAFDLWVLKKKPQTTPWFGLKFFNVFGPNEQHKGPMSSVAYKSFFQIRDKGELGLFKSYNPNYRDGEQLRDFIYVKDVTRWIWELMQKKATAPHGIYNMGYGKVRSWLDVAQALFKAMDKHLKINWVEMPDNIKNQYQYYTCANMDKWNQAGLSAPEWSLEKAMDDYVRNYLSKDLYL